MTLAEYQNKIIRQILLINDKSKLDEISRTINKTVRKIKLLKNENIQDYSDTKNFNSFEEWNEYLQSVEYQNPEEFLPEWGMTSLEFRKFFWDAEQSGTISYKEFVEDIKTWTANEA
jgi:superfamily I DNA/RNA helicase